jgi:hypothetical protein
MDSTTRNVDLSARRARYNKAQTIEIDWERVLNKDLYGKLYDCTISSGTPMDFWLMPLLSTASFFMNHSKVLVNPKTGWREPNLIWSVVSAAAGTVYIDQLSFSIFT